MTNIHPYTQSSPSLTASNTGRVARQTARELAAIDRATDMRCARIAAAGEVQQAKVDAVARTGGYALQQAALIAQMQQQLEMAVPAASGDLDFIKTVTLMGVGQIVADTSRAVNQ